MIGVGVGAVIVILAALAAWVGLICRLSVDLDHDHWYGGPHP